MKLVCRNSEARRTAAACASGAGLIAAILAAAFLAGCTKSPDNASVPLAKEEGLPTHAQPKLPTMKIFLGAETLDAELALTQRQEETGMMFRTNVTEASAMLFLLPVPQRASFWMKNCPVSLSAAYIGPDGVIEEIHHLEQNDTNPVAATADNIQFVLETKDGWFARHHVAPGAIITTERGSLPQTFLRNGR